MLSVRFFPSINALPGTEPTFLNLKFSDFRNFLTCVSPRSCPVCSLIFAAASPNERGVFCKMLLYRS
jgi:hypothetical protein